jgi:hypothetical protein
MVWVGGDYSFTLMRLEIVDGWCEVLILVWKFGDEVAYPYHHASYLVYYLRIGDTSSAEILSAYGR